MAPKQRLETPDVFKWGCATQVLSDALRDYMDAEDIPADEAAGMRRDLADALAVVEEYHERVVKGATKAIKELEAIEAVGDGDDEGEGE